MNPTVVAPLGLFVPVPGTLALYVFPLTSVQDDPASHRTVK
jgi:hypothetical protein